MGAESKEGDPSAMEEEPKHTETFAKEVGIIEPPPELREIIEKLAEFVRKNGQAFEEQIKQKQGYSKKFLFLRPENPYHAFYKHLVEHGKFERQLAVPTKHLQERLDEEAAAHEKENQGEEESVPEEEVKTLSLTERLKKMHMHSLKRDRPLPTDPPANTKFTVRIPKAFAAVDIDVIKLTAQYVARNGRSFLNGLQSREQHNPQFDFLRPSHPLFIFFQQMVAAYASVIRADASFKSKLEAELGDPLAVFERVLSRRKFEIYTTEKRKQREEDKETERIAMAEIDWHSFVIVETIGFEAADQPYLVEPRFTIDEINALIQEHETLEKNQLKEAELAQSNMLVEEEEEDTQQGLTDMERSDVASAVRRDYDRKKMKEAQTKALNFQTCPICGDEIALDDLAEHMRIELLDPKWKEQKKNMEEKQRETVLTDNANISQNLSRLARKRADVFIDTDEVGRKRKREEEERKRKELAVQWDGRKASANDIRQQLQQQQQQKQKQQQQHRPPPQMPSMPPRPGLPGMGGMPPSQGFRGGLPPMMPNAPLPNMPPRPQIPGLPAGQFVHPSRGMPGMPPPNMPPPQMGAHQPPPPTEPEPELQPTIKKVKTGGSQLVPEDEFLAKNPSSITVHVMVPNEEAGDASWKFNGQTLDIEIALADPVIALKKKIEEQVGIPAGKQKIKVMSSSTFLNKDKLTLAYYNVGMGNIIDLGVKERGRRRK